MNWTTLLLLFFVSATVARGVELPVHSKATVLRFEHACEPGPAVLKWLAQVRESVFQGTARPEPLPVFRYVVKYRDGTTLPIVVRWSEGVEGLVRRSFDPESRFIGPLAWAEVASQGPLNYEKDQRQVHYMMPWPNPYPDKEIAVVTVEEIPEAGKAVVFGVKAVNDPPTGKFYFVAPTGSDDHPGSFEKPWATPHKAAATAQAGDTVYFREGAYAVDKPVLPSHSGKEGAWITFCNYPGETAVLNGRAMNSDRQKNELLVDWNGGKAALISSRTGVFHILGRAYIRVLGLAVQDSGFGGICVDALPWWPVEGHSQPEIPVSHHLEILHNRVQRTSNVGIGVYGSIIPAYKPVEHIKVFGNLVLRAHDRETFLKGIDPAQNKAREEIRKTGKSKWGDENLDFHAVQYLECAYNEVAFGGKEGVDLMNGTRHARVHANYVHDQFFSRLSGGMVGIYLDCRSEQYDLEVDHNVCERNGTGIQANAEDDSPAHDLRIHHNLCKDNYWSGINVSMWTDKSWLIRDVKIEKNTVYRNGFLDSNKPPAGGIHIGSRTPNLRDISVRGNIVAGNRDYQLAYHQADLKAANIVFTQNLVWPMELKTYTDPKWSQRWVPTHGEQPILIEPQFLDPDHYNYGLRPGSPGADLGAFPPPSDSLIDKAGAERK